MSIFGRKAGQMSIFARSNEVWAQDGLAVISTLAQHGATIAGLAMAIDQSVQAHKDLATIRAALAEAKAAVEETKAAIEVRKVVAGVQAAQAAQATVPAAPKAPKAPKAKAPAGETEVVAAVPAEAKDVTPPPAAPTANRKVGRPRKNAGPAAPAAQA